MPVKATNLSKRCIRKSFPLALQGSSPKERSASDAPAQISFWSVPLARSSRPSPFELLRRPGQLTDNLGMGRQEEITHYCETAVPTLGAWSGSLAELLTRKCLKSLAPQEEHRSEHYFGESEEPFQLLPPCDLLNRNQFVHFMSFCRLLLGINGHMNISSV